ncbi:hypothetical protein OG429_22700 [Streptomyces sp. NBC_00190]|uniref:hypothetical protein n=1 Tax=unclassified Streptomyces TaxID=2593676 RepID=UPI002E2AC69E|nr:hypothetical protein [Streptomyces sp. NBC_00190]WSZ41847.1 hypothetical protein OG239_25475 [Streptomyces sp. NBC_00868]
MPRKPVSQVRADLPRKARRGDDRAVISGLSAKALAEIARIERRAYEPGAAHKALRDWRETVHAPGPLLMYPRWFHECPCCAPAWGGDHRETLEAICHGLSRRSARELRAVLAPLDERFLARTLNDPYASPRDRWWRRRLETS